MDDRPLGHVVLAALPLLAVLSIGRCLDSTAPCTVLTFVHSFLVFVLAAALCASVLSIGYFLSCIVGNKKFET
jgi:NhaP-type Na+/H+ and K+/H+ antiporter